MKKLCALLVLATAGFASFAADPVAEKKPYTIAVWADVKFDENSQISQVVIPEKDRLPKPFVGFVTSTVTSTQFATPENTASLKLMESGVRVLIEIDPNTNKARILAKDLLPRPLRVEEQSEPVVRVKGDFSGRIFVTCTVSAMGRCAKPRIEKTQNAPTEISKVLVATVGAWQYIPQKRDGAPIEGEFNTWVTIEANDTAPPEGGFGKEIKTGR